MEDLVDAFAFAQTFIYIYMAGNEEKLHQLSASFVQLGSCFPFAHLVYISFLLSSILSSFLSNIIIIIIIVLCIHANATLR